MAPPPQTTKRPGQKDVIVVRAMYDYVPTRPDELAFTKDEILVVLSKPSEDWWLCKTNLSEGENTAIIELPLHDASKRGNVQFASELLNAGIPSLKIGVSANALDKAGNAPIHWACRGGHAEIVTLLLSKGATNMSQNRMGDTPLHLAAYGNHFEAVQTLLDSGVTSVKNKAGSLPSDLAKDSKIAAMILQHHIVQEDLGPDSDDE